MVVYCRLPRGATTCDRREDLNAADFHTGAVGVVLRPDGTLYVVSNDVFTTFAVVSTDGGDSFGDPKAIGTVAPESAVVGPGLNTLMTGYSGSSSPEGAGIQVMPTDDAPVTGYAKLNDGPDRYYSGGVGLINETTPVSAYTDLTNTYVREYDATAGGDYNDADNWLPSTTLSGEDEPHVVTGPNGTFLMTHIEYDGNSLHDAYQVRRLSPADGSLGDPFLASDISASLFGTLTADSEGGLTAAWTDAGDTADIRSSYAKDSDGFTPPGVVAEHVRAYDIRVSTAGDAGGLVVWDDLSAQGKVYAAPIPVGGVVPDTDPSEPPPTSVGGFKPPKNTQKCTTSVTIKPGVVAAVQGGGCFDEAPKGVWDTTSDVNVNGIRFVGSKASTKVTVNTNSHTITATAGVVQSAGPIIFSKDAGTWDVDGKTVFEGLEKFGIKLFDFKALGQASVTFANGEAKVDANLALPKPFDIVTGGTTLTTTTKKGLSLVGIELGVQSLSIGIFELRDLSVTYDASSSSFTGHVALKLPPSGEYSKLTVGFRQGKLVRLSLAYGGPPFPFTVYPGLWINQAGFDYDGTDGFALGGGAEIGIPAPEGPITIDAIGNPPGTGGGFRFAQPTSGPARLDIAGTLKLFGFDLAGSHAYFIPADGQFGFDSNVDIGFPRLGVHGHVEGQVNLKDATFYSEASLEACVLVCLNGSGVISNIGVAACIEVDLFVTTLNLMAGYKWKSGLTAGSCDKGQFKTPQAGSGPAHGGVVVGSDGSIFTPARDGVTTYTVDIPGQGGIPQDPGPRRARRRDRAERPGAPRGAAELVAHGADPQSVDQLGADGPDQPVVPRWQRLPGDDPAGERPDRRPDAWPGLGPSCGDLGDHRRRELRAGRGERQGHGLGPRPQGGVVGEAPGRGRAHPALRRDRRQWSRARAQADVGGVGVDALHGRGREGGQALDRRGRGRQRGDGDLLHAGRDVHRARLRPAREGDQAQARAEEEGQARRQLGRQAVEVVAGAHDRRGRTEAADRDDEERRDDPRDLPQGEGRHHRRRCRRPGSEGEGDDGEALAQDQRRRRTSNVIGGSAIASWAATSWISRVPASMVFSRMAKTEDVVRARAVSAEPVLRRWAR